MPSLPLPLPPYHIYHNVITTAATIPISHLSQFHHFRCHYPHITFVTMPSLPIITIVTFITVVPNVHLLAPQSPLIPLSVINQHRRVDTNVVSLQLGSLSGDVSMATGTKHRTAALMFGVPSTPISDFGCEPLVLLSPPSSFRSPCLTVTCTHCCTSIKEN